MITVNITLEQGLMVQVTGEYFPEIDDNGTLPSDFEIKSIDSCNNWYDFALWIEAHSVLELSEMCRLFLDRTR